MTVNCINQLYNINDLTAEQMTIILDVLLRDSNYVPESPPFVLYSQMIESLIETDI